MFVSRRRDVLELLQLPVPTLLKDRIRLWKQGIRDIVMELCCALHNFRVRLTSWQPMVSSR
jgi:hypothetical protein